MSPKILRKKFKMSPAKVLVIFMVTVMKMVMKRRITFLKKGLLSSHVEMLGGIFDKKAKSCPFIEIKAFDLRHQLP